MKVYTHGNYLKFVRSECTIDLDMFLGWRQKKNDPWVFVEDNLVNRIVLGRPLDVEIEPPERCDTDLLEPFQIRDLKKSLKLRHYLNSNPMGLGKTPETIRTLTSAGATNALIVTPKIIRHQWQRQLKVWGDLEAQIYDRQRYVYPGFWVINYDRLRKETTRMKFKSFQWQYLIVDEAHKIKNRTSAQTLAVKDIPAMHRVALTGTPILRYVDDLWSILHFLDWRYSGTSYWNFRSYFCEVESNEWGNKIVGLTKDSRKVAILQQLLSTISIRNSEVEVAYGKHPEIVRLPMSKKQRDLYRKEKQLLLEELPDNLTIANGAVLTMRLMQTTSWPGLFIENEVGPKFEWILETCQNNPNEKFIVFSVFERTIKELVQWLSNNGVRACSITGKNDDKVNQASKELFLQGRAQVLAGTIGSMGQGYDGLQDVCRLMIVIDRDWSPEIMEQVEDRLHRKGQQNPVNIYYLECQGSFDQYVTKINVNKAKDIREALKRDD